MPSEQPPTRVEAIRAALLHTFTERFGWVISDRGDIEWASVEKLVQAVDAALPTIDEDERNRLYELFRRTYDACLSPRDTTYTPSDATYEALMKVLDEVSPAPPSEQPREEGRGFTREELRRDTYLPGKDGALQPATARGEGDDLAARLEEKARAESDEFGNYHDRYAEGPALPEPPRIESAPARVETEDIERLRDVVDRFDDGVGMNYLYVESLGRILDSLGDLTYKDLAEVDEIVIERGKTSGPEAFSWATPPKGGFDPRHDASRGPDRPASPSQSPTPTEQGETDHA